MIGKTISHYEILAKIGEGGMGVVYRARDTRLGREVALKFLGDELRCGREHLQRFQREAEVLASMSHPGIAVIHDVGEVDGCPYLALEFLKGETLAARLQRGPLPADQAIQLMRDVASALAAAHARGVIHRDLKPGNLMLTPAGEVKILDFGLARVLPTAVEKTGSDGAPATISELTRPGRLMGTAGYMSPEQVRGEAVDARTDIWALGCCLFECLTGRRAFSGATVSECVAAVLMGGPDWTQLPDRLPSMVATVLERCLRKDPQRRYHSVADVGIELEDALAGDPAGAVPELGPPSRRSRVLWTALGALVIGLIGGALVWQAMVRPTTSPLEAVEFIVPVAPDVMLDASEAQPIAISPDGRRLALAGRAHGVHRLWYFELGTPEAVPLPGTENALAPFFSPDGDWIAFFAENELRKISVNGGSVITICHQWLLDGHHGTWGDDGAILFEGWSKTGNQFLAVAAAGGEPWVPFIDDHLGHCLLPSFLPGGKTAIVVATHGQSFDNHWLAVLELGTGAVHPLLEFTTGRWLVEYLHPQYLDTGHIVYVEEGAIKAVPFDPDRLELRGEPVVASARLTRNLPTYVAVSRAGTIVYLLERDAAPSTRDATRRQLVLIDHEGNADTLAIDLPGRPMYGIFDPDGRSISLTVAGKDFRRLWTIDLERGIVSPLTFGQNDHVSLWSPDGRHLAFSSDRDGPSNLYWKTTAASTTAERLTWSENHQCPSCWTPDGRTIVFTEFTAESGGDIWMIDPTEPGRPRALAVTSDSETNAMVSPDGRWLAYSSNLTGRSEVCLARFPDTSRRVQVSNSGGHSPIWSPDGRELYYLRFLPGLAEGDDTTQAAMVVAVDAGEGRTLGKPRQLFTGVFVSGGSARPHWDISPDGSRFLLVTHQPHAISARDLRMVLHWSARLK